ncbi:zf-HC2 domain-containing protein [Kitasatospora viridis]|uniref:Putative zinc finger protein n=1 Tax=Kitasatospora viridis TaxID=281105 RepID=A0A561UAP9_9ACTN|nr:zf-HC2 domain-containing protein [Kitasatospora viridis]TWF96430.1 putative zinc finger protein [Kitasatospora viridis]
MSTDHASTRLLDEYARGDAAMAADTVWALEAHLETCAPCRGRLAAAVATGAPGVAALVDAVRAGLEPQLDAAVQTPARRRRPSWVTTWLTPAAAPWLAVTVAVALLALALGSAGAPAFDGASPLVLIAPVLPLCAVAGAWSRALDPAHELTAATARAGLPLLLRRATAALVVVVPVLLVGGLLTGATTAAQWLLPSLAFTSTALALGSVIGVTRAAAALVAAWGAVIAVPWGDGRLPLALLSDQLPVWAVLLALGTGTVIARRNAYSTL